MLSVIMPTFNSERGLILSLPALVPGAMSGVVREVTLADGGSTDTTLAIADGAGCAVLGSQAPLGRRLREAAAAARSPWLMFLRPGTVLESGWVEDAARFMDEADHGKGKTAGAATGATPTAAVFRRSVAAHPGGAGLREAVALMAAALRRRLDPGQGLLIAAALYGEVGGHREAARDPETDLLVRLGRRRIVMLRSGARI